MDCFHFSSYPRNRHHSNSDAFQIQIIVKATSPSTIIHHLSWSRAWNHQHTSALQCRNCISLSGLRYGPSPFPSGLEMIQNDTKPAKHVREVLKKALLLGRATFIEVQFLQVRVKGLRSRWDIVGSSRGAEICHSFQLDLFDCTWKRAQYIFFYVNDSFLILIVSPADVQRDGVQQRVAAFLNATSQIKEGRMPIRPERNVPEAWT